MVPEPNHRNHHGEPQHVPFPHAYPSLDASSADVVRALFGDFGPCSGDFFCSHSRVGGRLFVCGRAALFYSNLLGFERRICLPYGDIADMELYRTTSIRITLYDGWSTEYERTTHVFRSFNDRVQVLQLLKFLKLLATTTTTTAQQQRQQQHLSIRSLNFVPAAATGATAAASLTIPRRSESSDQLPSLCASASSSSPLSSSLSRLDDVPASAAETTGNRRRSVSDSFLRFPARHEDDVAAAGAAAAALSGSFLAESDDDDGNEEAVDPVKDAWDRMKKGQLPQNHNATIPVEQQQQQHSCAESLALNCSLDTFFDTFLADDAPYSLDKFQTETIQDRDVHVTKWVVMEDNDIVTEDDDTAGGITTWKRTITFRHPLKNNVMMMGPSEAPTTRRQKLVRFGRYGFAVQNQTTTDHVPYCDAFYVQDTWLVEAAAPAAAVTAAAVASHDDDDDEDEVVLYSARYSTCFTKRCLFKSVIESTVKSETKAWYDRYRAWLRQAVSDGRSSSKLKKVEQATSSASAAAAAAGAVPGATSRSDGGLPTNTCSRLYVVAFLLVATVSVSLLLLVIIAQLQSLREEIAFMKNELNALKAQHERFGTECGTSRKAAASSWR